MSAGMELHVALSMRLDAVEAYRLAHNYRDEVLAAASQPEPEALTTARAAVAPLIAHDTGDRPRWRIIHTDSESPSGVALACTGENSDALHMIDDYPGGPIRDEEGVYDCCPWPQFETYSPVLAAYLVELLNADAEEKTTPEVGAAVTPDFFQPGHTYTDGNGFRAPELVSYFRVEHVTRHPDRGHLRAIGWLRSGAPNAGWHGDFRDEDEFDGWTDVTETGDRS
jgi:hypothetical protein